MATQTTNYHLSKPDATDPFGNFRQSYNDNMDIIDANLGGGGGGGDVMDVEVNGVSVVDGNKVAKITSYKEVTQAQYNALPATKLTDGIAYFIKDGGGSGSGSSFLLVITAETGETVTATKGATTLTATETSTGIYEVTITEPGTWTLTDGSNTTTVDVGVYTATLSSVPEGSTVLPTDDVSIWLACGERTEEYTTLSQVLGDSVCLSALLNNNNANDYLVRSTTWASTITADSSAMTYIGLNNYCANTLLADATWLNAIANSEYIDSVLNVKVPVMTSTTTPEGTVSSTPSGNSTQPWYPYDGNSSTRWAGEGNYYSHYNRYTFTTSHKFYVIKHTMDAEYSITTSYKVKYQASTDGVTWEDVSNEFTYTFNGFGRKKETIILANPGEVYKGCGMMIVSCLNGSNYISFGTYDLQFYGRRDI